MKPRVFILIVILFVPAGCKWGCGDMVLRDAVSEPNEQVVIDGSPPDPAIGGEALPNGSPCENAHECVSGHCVGGTCCEEACDSPCLTCSAEGLCLPSSGRLMVSANFDRSSAKVLQGARLAGAFYLFAETCRPVSEISYYWEVMVELPFAIAKTEPFDLSGTTDSRPNFLSSLVMPKGLHTLVAVGKVSDGSTLPPFQATATFDFPAGVPGQEMALYSTSPSRENPQPLQNATVKGTIHVFLAPGLISREYTEVSFYLDDPAMSAAAQIEQVPPFDLGGGSVGLAKPVQSTTLSNGQHALWIVVRDPSAQRTIQVEFTVAN